MLNYFGTVNPKIPPNSFSQATQLETTFRNQIVGKGRWTKMGFHLLKGSFVKKMNTLKSNPGVLEIRTELIHKGFLVEYDSKHYLLTEDILLPSPSTAARLVHGNDRDGLIDWKSRSGIPLSLLLQSI